MSTVFLKLVPLILINQLVFSGFGRPEWIFTPAPQDHASCIRNALEQSLTKDQTRDSSIGFHAFDSPLGLDQSSLTKAASPKLSVFAVLPESAAEFKGIFHYAPSKQQIENLATYQAMTRDLPTTKYYKEGKGTYLCRFEEHLKHTDADHVALIGHNNDGMFYFPDGNNATFSYLIDLCNKHKKKPIFLSCQAKQFADGRPAPRSRLTYKEAIGIAHKVQEYFTKLDAAHNVSYKDISMEVQRIIDSSQTSAQVKYVTKIVGGTTVVIGTIVLFILSEDKKDNQKE